jgi:hypothetical protein
VLVPHPYHGNKDAYFTLLLFANCFSLCYKFLGKQRQAQFTQERMNGEKQNKFGKEMK